MLSKKLEAALNKQIHHEFENAFFYLAMATYFRGLNLGGFAAYARKQGQDEIQHGMMLYDYVAQRGGKASVAPVGEQPKSWKSPLAAIEDSHKKEAKTSELINQLVSLALQEGDHGTHVALQPLVAEQTADESSAEETVQRMRLLGDAPGALFMMDRDMERRVAMAGK